MNPEKKDPKGSDRKGLSAISRRNTRSTSWALPSSSGSETSLNAPADREWTPYGDVRGQ